MGRRKIVVAGLGLGILLCFAGAGYRNSGDLPVRLANAQEAPEDWRREFDEVCSKTQDAMVIPSDELERLVARCDKLKPRMERLDESQRKVFLKRLQLCRDLYSFVLESRANKQ